MLTLGDGADHVTAGHWINAGVSTLILDFDSTEDQLVVLRSFQNQPDPDTEIEAVSNTPDQSIIRANGTEALRVNSPAGISLNEVVLIDQTGSTLPGLPTT
ncbi:hypothetical protein DL239_13090 [Sedimentitalea sp. CY04]|uniref:Haemolysin-type calcium binding-related domain-containing protein n=1 Tax=Parasedimentitalea denitrificans TaxID=2211118 RepID=A0ABX0WB62_9RHOB|nr:hypothetical protein [Sedimentitalea sp. CY04]NIZ61910.1 hypothetical protein [Sedimentitalea sp. CY04]